MSAVQPDVFAVLAAIDADPSQDIVPTRRDYRDDVRRAVAKAAREHGGYVHASWVRPHLPSDIPPSIPGAVVGALIRSGHLAPTTRPALPNGGPSGNATRLSRVFRLVRSIEGVPA